MFNASGEEISEIALQLLCVGRHRDCMQGSGDYCLEGNFLDKME
jgi:hypothetical protein